MLLRPMLPSIAPSVMLRPLDKPDFCFSDAGLDRKERDEAVEFDLTSGVPGPAKPRAEAANVLDAF